MSIYEYAAEKGANVSEIQSSTSRIDDYGAHLLGLEQKCITLGLTKYTKDPGKYHPDDESVKALRAFQIARYTCRSRADEVFDREREEYLTGLPHTD